MTTSNIKLMLHAMRLGQPQDPQAALRALAEAIEAQDDLIEELRARIGVLQSHVQILGAKASHQQEAPVHEPPPQPAYDPRARANYERAAPKYEAYQEAPAAYEPPPYEPPPGYDAGGYEDYREEPQGYEAQQGYEAPAQQAYEAQRAYEPPPAERMATTPGRLSPRPGRGTLPHTQSTHTPSGHAQPSLPTRGPAPTRSAPPPAPRPQAQLPVLTQEDSADEDYRAETVVVNKRDIEKLRQKEAPFELPPPGARAPEARKSIPGAPWARGARGTAPNAPPQNAQGGGVNEDFTVDMPPGGEPDEGDTYRDRGYQPPPGRGRPPGGR